MKYVGIITAMNEELEAVRKLMDDEQDLKTIFGLDIIIGKIYNTDCVLVRCGAGKVNAARTTQILIDNFDINYIINIGVAGSLNYKFDIGDVIIGEKVVQHDFDITAFGHSKGYVPGVGNEAFSDHELLEKFKSLIKNSEEKIYNIETGTIATGDIFVTEISMKDKIASKFKADCVEMEASAVAQVCVLSNIPFISIRSISDKPNNSNEKDYEQNIKLASKRATNLLKDFFINEKISREITE